MLKNDSSKWTHQVEGMWSICKCEVSSSVQVVHLCMWCVCVSVCKCLYASVCGRPGNEATWVCLHLSQVLCFKTGLFHVELLHWNWINYTDCGQLFTWLLIFTAAVYNGNPSSQGPLFSTDQSESRLIPLSPKKDFVIFHLRLTKYTHQLHISSLSGNRKLSSLARSVTQ